MAEINKEANRLRGKQVKEITRYSLTFEFIKEYLRVSSSDSYLLSFLTSQTLG